MVEATSVGGCTRRRPAAHTWPLVCLLLLGLLGARATADQDETPYVLPEIPAAIVKAVEAEDEATLKAYAEAREHDPWAIVDELVSTGHKKEAIALAALVEGPDAESLQHYAAEPPEDDPKARAAYREAVALFGAGKEELALERLRKTRPPPGSILAVRMPALGGRILWGADAWSLPFAAYRAAGRAAKALGRDLMWEVRALEPRYTGQLEADDYRSFEVTALQMAALQAMERREYPAALALLDLGVVSIRLRLSDASARYLRTTARILEVVLASAEQRWHARIQNQLARCEMNRCIALSNLGRFPDALAAGERAVAAASGSKSTWIRTATRRELGNAFAMLGDMVSALRHYRDALEVHESAQTRNRLVGARLKINVGHALQELGRHEQAREVLEDALRVLQGLDAGDEAAVALMNLGEIHEQSKRWTEARTNHERALAFSKHSPLLQAYAHMHIADAILRGGVESDAGALREASAHYAQAIAEHEAWVDPTLDMFLALGQGEIALAEGRYKVALTRAEEALRRLSEMTQGLADGEIVAARGHPDRARAETLGMAAAARLDQPAQALGVLERSRAQAFLAALGGRRALLDRVLDPAQRRVLARADARLTTETVIQRKALTTGDLRSARKARAALAEAETGYAEVLGRMERESRQYARGVRPVTVEMTELRKSLDAADMVVMYSLQEPASHALVIRKDGEELVSLPGRGVVEGLVRALRASDKTRSREEIEGDLAALRKAVLSELKLGRNGGRLYVCPDGELAHVPWSMLLPADVLAHRKVALVPSGTVLSQLRKQVGTRGTARIAVGDPLYRHRVDESLLRVYAGGTSLGRLPETEAEARRVAGEGGTLLLRENATEARLTEACRRQDRLRVLHFGCHGLLNRRNPALSALALTPDGDDDGFLTSLEVYLLHLPCDLVVLSACDLAGDRTARGEGLTGLTRAFMLAGASCVVASLWKVRDEPTAALMARFYDEWDKPTVGAAEALQTAQAHVRERWPHPRDWGAWVLWGMPD